LNSLELTTFITAVANVVSSNIEDNDIIALLGSAVTQLGDTLTTISLQRALCDKNKEQDESPKED